MQSAKLTRSVLFAHQRLIPKNARLPMSVSDLTVDKLILKQSALGNF